MMYPAIFHIEENTYWVEFPDLIGCQSFGDTLDEAHENAKEALSAYLVTLFEQGKKPNPPTDIRLLNVEPNAFTSLVEVDLIKKSQSVNKTLTIPSWLNDIAEKSNVNFSQLLQKTLMEHLHLTH
ncbi:MAG: type II toxin-antitoxin system HicB family antitoxin [Turicibacter sp.]|nr:type II toxin-antitoxin system HicB family antitoxin [Turicibacter sp.]